MDVKNAVIESAARLLAQSVDGAISTRAVCEASGIQQPALYRIFGDKEGLLAETVDYVWEKYLSVKRSAERSADPLVDLRAGWDSHTAFAVANPNAYRLLFGSSAVARAASADEAQRLLQSVLERLAAQGRLRLVPESAAQQVMAANTGLALALILRPKYSNDPGLSSRMRESVIESILVPGGAASQWSTELTDTGADALQSSAAAAVVSAAITLRSGLQTCHNQSLTAAELTLLNEWLIRISDVSTIEGVRA